MPSGPERHVVAEALGDDATQESPAVAGFEVAVRRIVDAGAATAFLDDVATAGTRDHMLGPMLLDAARYPVIHLQSEQISGDANDWRPGKRRPPPPRQKSMFRDPDGEDDEDEGEEEESGFSRIVRGLSGVLSFGLYAALAAAAVLIVWNLRSGRCFKVLKGAFAASRGRFGMRLIEFAVMAEPPQGKRCRCRCPRTKRPRVRRSRSTADELPLRRLAHSQP